MDVKTDVLLEDLCFTEGPRWHDERLWFSDMHDQAVMAVDLSGQSEKRLTVENDPSGLGWLPDGRLLVVSMRDRKLLREDAEGLVVHADLSELASYHCNDMVTDGKGRSYVGNFGFDLHVEGAENRPAELVLVDADGAARVVARDLRFPNGTVITPDGSTLVVGESFGACLTAFDVEEDGSLSNRRLWARLERAVPDGICLDAQGAIWVASPLGNEVLRVREGGEVTHRVTASQNAIACMLGGPEGRHLFVCTSSTTQPDVCKASRPAKIEVCQVDVPGAGWP
ncbi:MAG: SMP-30/gluconolactonase/LRE family protein [Myxococcota bacterium]